MKKVEVEKAKLFLLAELETRRFAYLRDLLPPSASRHEYMVMHRAAERLAFAKKIEWHRFPIRKSSTSRNSVVVALPGCMPTSQP
jgi:hypothetical protein